MSNRKDNLGYLALGILVLFATMGLLSSIKDDPSSLIVFIIMSIIGIILIYVGWTGRKPKKIDVTSKKEVDRGEVVNKAYHVFSEKKGTGEVAFFESDVPSGNGVCSDNNCPCPEVVIPRGSGYLYIDQGLVDFRREYPSLMEAREAMKQQLARMPGTTLFYRLGPILVCAQGARLRKLDLDVAAADARYWWETGKVPLRATPMSDSSDFDRK